MKIKELEEQLNITRSNIRFYEKEGLLTPKRDDNGYREYDENDIEILKKIILFRKLGLSVEIIDQIFNHEISIDDAIKQNIESLNNQIEQLNGAISVCEELDNRHISIDNLETDYYMNIIHNKEKQGYKFLDLCNDCLEVGKEVMHDHLFYADLTKSRGINIILSLIIMCLIYEFIYYILGTFVFHEQVAGGYAVPIVGFVIYSFAYLPGIKKINNEEEWKTYKENAMCILGAIGIIVIIVFFFIDFIVD